MILPPLVFPAQGDGIARKTLTWLANTRQNATHRNDTRPSVALQPVIRDNDTHQNGILGYFLLDASLSIVLFTCHSSKCH